MANYLERVATSAGRRAAIAKPPVSGPPVLPAGRDFSIAPGDPFVIDEELFVETPKTSAPARTEERAEIAAAPSTRLTENETVAAPVEPKPKTRPSHERLSSESPFTVHVPRTLRPISDIPPPTANEPPRERIRVRASTTVGPAEFTIREKPTPLVRSTEPNVNEPITATADTTALTPRPNPPVAEEHQAPRPVHTQTTLSDTTPIPRVDRVDGPSSYIAEPSPSPASPVHLPPVTGNATRQEQSSISIGSLEVLVNNQPRVPTARPAAAPPRSERLNLEKRYLDRFRLRH